MAIFVAIGLAVVAVGLSFVLRPKPKTPQNDAAKQLESPVAEAGKEISVVFGTDWNTELNCLWYGQKQRQTKEISG